MKKFALFLLLILAFQSALAHKTIQSFDIINSSDTPITIEYNVCFTKAELIGIFSDPIKNGQETYRYGNPKKKCETKTSKLNPKNTGDNYLEIQLTEKREPIKIGDIVKSEKNIYISKILSALGEQDLISSSEEANEIFSSQTYDGKALSRCMSEDRNTNMIILDNMGTNKFYCHSSLQAN
ncbi:hypothetical protein A6J40_01885 [Legionella longbeachae]|uniref:hypothetical protein n=1 Tax=Legionella longbeachae TaxID=450 RepID=UPI0009B7AC2F|nr:hypothetical protein [Legionella longbeachae]VEE02728.1 Uncharacterised protein [Legionella oakridgensis]ARB91011.1 hypothetical protein A6J40_01885 [Legionella longbeachae]ARM32562.1 hypothetical protein B0B39_03030 [Legionella longbeachae]RZV21197.1 hypothetical protein EKG34_17255 [Legionella longbeachae]UAK45789.1 hypothetical protein K8O86_13480 [Legionella longbeachae]